MEDHNFHGTDVDLIIGKNEFYDSALANLIYTAFPFIFPSACLQIGLLS